MENEKYILVKTTDNTSTYIRKDQIAAVEQIAGTTRTKAYLKVYVAGYSFGVDDVIEDFLKKISTK